MKAASYAPAAHARAPTYQVFYRYLQLSLLVIAAGAIYPVLYLRQMYQSTMLEVLAIDNAQLGILYSILGSAFLISYLPSGWLADRISPRFLVSFSLLGTGSLAFAYAMLPGYTALLLIFCGFGITTGLTFWASLLKRVKMIAGDDGQGRFFGILDGGRGLVEALLATIAIALFAYLAGADASGQANGLQAVIRMYAATCVVLGVVLAFVRDPASLPASNDAAVKGSLLADLRFLARTPELWLVTAIVFCGYHFFWATYSFSAYLEAVDLGVSATMAGVITTIKLWMRPLGGIGGGWLGDRFSNLRVLMAAMLLAAFGMICLIGLPALQNITVLAVMVVFIGLMTYAIRGLYWAVLDTCGIPMRCTGLAIGIVSVAGYSPDVILPLLNGWITETWPGLDGYRIYFAYVLCIGLLGVLAAWKLQRMVAQKAHKS